MEEQKEVLICCKPGCSVKLLYWSEEEERGVCIKHWQDEEGDLSKVWRITGQSYEDVLKCRDEIMMLIEKWKDDENNSRDKCTGTEFLDISLKIIEENFDKLKEYLENEELCKFSEANNGCKCKLSSDQVSNARKLPPHEGYMRYLDPETLFKLVSIPIERIKDESGLQDPSLKEDNQHIPDENIQEVIDKVNNEIEEILKKKILLSPKNWKLFNGYFKKLEKEGNIEQTGNFHSQSLSKTLCFEMISNAFILFNTKAKLSIIEPKGELGTKINNLHIFKNGFKEYQYKTKGSMLTGIKDSEQLYKFMLIISFRRLARLQNLEKSPELDRANLLTTDSKFFFRRIFEFRDKEEKIQENIYDNTLPKDNDNKLPCEHDDCQLPSFYYLPEYEIKLCFLHRFHSDYKDLSKCICLRPHNLLETFKITKKPIPKDIRQSLLIGGEASAGKDIILSNIDYFKEFIQNELILHCFDNEKKSLKNKQSQDSTYFEDDLISAMCNNKNNLSYLIPALNAHKFSKDQKDIKLKIMVYEEISEKGISIEDIIKRDIENEENFDTQDDTNSDELEDSTAKGTDSQDKSSDHNLSSPKDPKSPHEPIEEDKAPQDNPPIQNQQPPKNEESKHSKLNQNEEESESESDNISDYKEEENKSLRSFVEQESSQNFSNDSKSKRMEEYTNFNESEQEESKDEGYDSRGIPYSEEEKVEYNVKINKLYQKIEQKILLKYHLFFNSNKGIYQNIEDNEEFQKEYLALFDAEIEEELVEILKIQFTKEYSDKLKEIIHDKELIIDFRNDRDYKFFSEFKYIIKLKKVEFTNVPKEDKHIQVYLLQYFPEFCDSLTFKLENKTKKDGINFYFDGLKQISSRIKKDLNLWYCKLNQDQIVSLFEEWKDIKKIEFNCCELNLKSVPNLGDSLKYSKIETFKLCYCGDWKLNRYQFVNLAQGLYQIKHFFQNLKSLYIWGNKISKQEVLQILQSCSSPVTPVTPLTTPKPILQSSSPTSTTSSSSSSSKIPSEHPAQAESLAVNLKKIDIYCSTKDFVKRR
ncbi:unnamed protein product [Moneuplotes crassus]|uniref:Uncharacterized protein n=1 Tax=Euplotes crassus TaxID=5936 RepID=A0AAD1UN86_EUPCR|nr:unnamed protein product [Moneuplotes crassus]